MAILQIYSLDDEDEKSVISTLSEGEHIIGRDKLNCKDKRISRNHALLVVTENDIVLKSTHVNPSFYKPNGGNSIKLIKKDEFVNINDGDQFAFLADAFWFRTRVTQESSSSNKRANTDDELQENSKRVKSNDHLADASPNVSSTNQNIGDKCEKEAEILENYKAKEFVSESEESIDFSVTNENGQKENDLPGIDQDNLNKEVGDMNDTDINDNKGENINDKAIADEDRNINKTEETKSLDVTDNTDQTTDTKSDDDNTNNPSTSTKRKREKCWYGAKCYRKNIIHKQDFSHPGDSDYDASDVLPHCPFGSSCYRTNIAHRKQYKHINPPGPKPLPGLNTGNNTNQNNSDDEDSDDNMPQGRKKRKAAAKVKKYAETPEDDYDLEDPFINDASSDDFQLSDDDASDSDWQDSQEVEEESQERRRLLKEAKKFTKQKNKK